MPVVLYKRQRDILDFIKEFIKKNGYSPTLAEIAAGSGVTSPATVHEHVINLEKKGLIRRASSGARAMEIIPQRKINFETELNEQDLPLLGFIAAGKPLEPYSDPNATFAVPKNLIPQGKTCFVLQVKGDSMIEEGIFNGDFVVIVKQQEANDGEIVVALLETGMATLKKFFKEATQIRLEPANAKMSPIYATNVRIQGKLIALVRRFT